MPIVTSIPEHDFGSVLPANVGRQCPVCGEKATAWLHRFTLAQAAEWIAPKVLDEELHARARRHIERLWNQDFADVVRCLHCKFCFPVPYVALDRAAWADLPPSYHYPARRWEFRQAVNFLSAADTPRTLLEVGAGEGHFVHLLKQDLKFAGCEMFATEWSPRLVAKLRQLSIKTESADVEELAESPIWRGRFDCILCFNALPYMAPADRVFAAFRSLLGIGGFLCLSVADGERIDFNEERLNQWDMPPLRVGRWYKNSFDAVATTQGFQVVSFRLEPYRKGRLMFGLAREYFETLIRRDHQWLPKLIGSVPWRPLRAPLKLAAGTMLALPKLPLLSELHAGYSQFIVLQKI